MRVRVINQKSDLYGQLGTLSGAYLSQAFVVLDCDAAGPVAEFDWSELEELQECSGPSSFSVSNRLTSCVS